MDESLSHSLPTYREMGLPAVQLLQGVIYSDDAQAWDALLANESELIDYFARIGLVLIIDTTDGLAYLRQLSDDEKTDGYEQLPRLFRRTTLGYEATLLCVLLRDEFRRFEDEDLDNERCVVESDVLFESWRAFFPNTEDDVRLRRRLNASLAKLEKLKLVRPFHRETDAWEIRRILKAKLPIQELETLRLQLLAAVESPSILDDSEDENRSGEM